MIEFIILFGLISVVFLCGPVYYYRWRERRAMDRLRRLQEEILKSKE